MPIDSQFRYEDVVGFVASLINRGALPVGARAPSLRQICKQRRVSLATAVRAYGVLEDRGLLEARPQSGYYVASNDASSLPTPGLTQPRAGATVVEVSTLWVQLLEHASDPKLAPLGCAVPSASLLKAGRLDRFLSRAARVKGVASNIYTVPRGDPKLRREIARRALRWGQELSPEDIVITSGCTEALILALRTVARPGDTVAIESPTFFGLLHALQVLNLKAIELPTDATTGVDLKALRRVLSRARVSACLLSSSFNNPLGCTMPDTNKAELLQLLAKRDIPLIEDDIYGDIYFGAERPKPFMSLAGRGNRILYCTSFSKTIAPGYRLGWLATTRYMQSVLDHKLATTLCGPVLPQVAFADYLSSGGYDNHLRRMRRTFAQNVDHAIRVIDRSFPSSTKVTRPAGGFVLWLELPRPVNSRELLNQALKSGICFIPGELFSASGQYRNCLRLSCGHEWGPRIQKAIETLGALVTAA